MKVTRENLQKVAEELADNVPDEYRHVPKHDAIERFKMYVEASWSDGIEVFMNEEGFFCAEAGVMDQYEVVHD